MSGPTGKVGTVRAGGAGVAFSLPSSSAGWSLRPGAAGNAPGHGHPGCTITCWDLVMSLLCVKSWARTSSTSTNSLISHFLRCKVGLLPPSRDYMGFDSNRMAAHQPLLPQVLTMSRANTPTPWGAESWPHRERDLRTRTSHKHLLSLRSSVFQIFHTSSQNKVTGWAGFRRTNPAVWESGRRFGESPVGPPDQEMGRHSAEPLPATEISPSHWQDCQGSAI